MNTPKKIEQLEKELRITWDDGRVDKFDFKFLRDESPDAGNKGETILWNHIPPPPKGPDKPGKYEIASLELVGSYAVNIKWKDGNADGIYSWDILRRWGDFLSVKKNLNKDK